MVHLVPFNGVSAILPVYMKKATPERLELLTRAALSVLEQDCPLPVELFIIDDGCAAPLSELRAMRSLRARSDVHFVRLPRNQGLVFALNAGLQRAHYDLIARIDDDDRWRAGKLDKQLAAFRKDPELTLVGTAMRTVHHSSELDRDHVRGKSWREILEYAATVGCPFPHGSILARRDVFAALGGYSHAPAYRYCEDYALWVKWIRFFKCAMLPEVLFEYSVREEQISSRHAHQQLASSRLVQRSLAEMKGRADIPDSVTTIAKTLGRSLLETSKILYVAWRYYTSLLVDPPLLSAVRTVLQDRSVSSHKDIAEVLTDRCLYLNNCDGYNRHAAAHIPRLHCISDIAALLV